MYNNFVILRTIYKDYTLVKKIFLFCLFLSTAFSVFAQKEEAAILKYPKDEIHVSYGFLPIIGLFYPDGFWITSDYYDVFPFEERAWTQGFNVQYNHYFNKLNALSLDFSWSIYKHKQAHIDNYDFEWKHVNFFTLQIGYGIHYYNTKMISLYSSFYAGATFYCIGKMDGTPSSSSDKIIYPDIFHYIFRPALQVNFLGIRVGQRNAANFEIGFGTQGVLKMGYSYQF